MEDDSIELRVSQTHIKPFDLVKDIVSKSVFVLLLFSPFFSRNAKLPLLWNRTGTNNWNNN